MSGKSKRNLMVGKWMPTDRLQLLKWAKKEFDKVKASRPEQYAAFKEYFPDADTEDEILSEFIKNAARMNEIKDKVVLHDSIANLMIAMGKTPEIGMLMIEMFRQQSGMFAELATLDGLKVVDAIFFLNTLITMAPRYIDEDLGISIPVPFGCFMTYAMATPAGFAAFIKKEINALFKDILNEYKAYLMTGESTSVLVNDIPGGWFTEQALEAMSNFDETYVCDPLLPHKGYKSFDAFFTRHVRSKARPIANPSDPYTIVNACENAPYKINYSVKQYDAFWIKTQPYSLQYILDNDPNLDKFIGGTVFQGFLSPHTYHRFHAPVSGEVVRADVLDGTYFAQPYYKDSEANYIASQPYLAHVAARGIIIIDTKVPEIGMVAFVPIGMVDVSSVDLSIKVKDQVNKGDNIGTFHFGGSSHLLIFESKVRLAFDLQGIQPDPLGSEFLKVNSRIATIMK